VGTSEPGTTGPGTAGLGTSGPGSPWTAIAVLDKAGLGITGLSAGLTDDDARV
jgi:hypothetical protein